jgi:hypothetical protein
VTKIRPGGVRAVPVRYRDGPVRGETLILASSVRTEGGGGVLQGVAELFGEAGV